ncbi:MAG: hypothetical protein PHH01_00485 [Patescibacteria group bacterium]|nr:hypothetical protein [Patescibacteria group bacterium]
MKRYPGIAVAMAIRGQSTDEYSAEHNTLLNLSRLGIPIFAATSCTRAQNLGVQHLPNLTLIKSTMDSSQQLRWAIKAASENAPHVLWMAGDNVKLSAQLPRQLDRAFGILSTDISIIFFGRTPRALRTYPAFQQLAEEVTNQAASKLALTPGLDITYGAVLFCNNNARNIQLAPDHLTGRELLFWLYGKILRNGSVGMVRSQFVYPYSRQLETPADYERLIANLRDALVGFSLGYELPE